jgi:hypothetical protein
MPLPEFICIDCNAHVFVYSGDSGVVRERCYNCAFIRRVADSPEQEAELRKVLGCERQEREAEDDNSGV